MELALIVEEILGEFETFRDDESVNENSLGAMVDDMIDFYDLTDDEKIELREMIFESSEW